MVTDGKWTLCTVEELAKTIVSEAMYITYEDRKNYKGYDFGLADYRDRKDDEDLECLASGVEGWYGIHSIESGFDGEEMLLCCDYYGGGYNPQFVVLWGELEFTDIISDVTGAILKVLDANEGASFTKETMLICEKGD